MKKNIFSKTPPNKKSYQNTAIHEKCCSFVINLERRPDRLEQFERRYTPNDFMDLHIKKAVDGAKLNIPRGKKLNSGEHGVFLSHYEIWKYGNILKIIQYPIVAYMRTMYSFPKIV